MLRMGLGVVLLVVATPMRAAGEDKATLAELYVETAVVRPIKGDGHFWDGVHAKDVPKLAGDRLQAEVTRLIAKELVRAGATASLAATGAALAVFAAKKLNDVSTPPDPFGEVVVDGRAIAPLPLVQDRLDPSWAAHGVHYVPVMAGSSVDINVFDSDLSGAHDPIGTCHFSIGEMSTGDPRRVRSERCSGDLLAAALVVKRGSTAMPVQPGAFRIVAARAGIQPSKVDGRPWDPGGLADPMIRIEVGGRAFLCPKNQGSRVAVCAPEALAFDLDEQTTIAMRIVDVDAVLDDVVGAAEIGGLTSKQAGAPLTMTTSGSIAWAEVVIEPAQGVSVAQP
jgi:hypothetical protein